MADYCMVLTTTSSDANKEALICEVLQHKLAACIQTMKIESHYVWQEELCKEHEWLLIMKTTKRCYAELEQLICEQHKYETPQIVQVPIVDGFNPYLTWLDKSTRC